MKFPIALEKPEEIEVAKLFKDTIYLERELESAKIDLSLKPDFNLKDCYQLFDPQGKGYLTAYDLTKSLQS